MDIHPIPNKESKTIAEWFLSVIVKRYGVPQKVRTDQGGEFGGAFHKLLHDLGI